MSLDYSSTKHTPANDQKILAMNGSTAGYIDTDEFRDNYILASKGQANGLASLDSNGKLVTSQLPDMADDVLSYANYAAFPVTGYDGILYIAKDTNKIYRWNGSAYVELTVDISGKADTSYVNAQLALKANAATTYTKAEVDTALGSKADSSTTYTKTEVDSAISPKADTSTVNTLKADITGKLGVYNFTQVDANTTVILDGDSEQNLAQMVQATPAYEQDAIMLSLEPIIPTASTHNFGIKGQIAIDSDYLYVCVAENTWKKITLQNL